MTITLNGKSREIAAVTLAELLVEIELGDAIVATALNGRFVPARSRGEASVAEGDAVEIVAPMQGG
jgi:sulfur carrier protein